MQRDPEREAERAAQWFNAATAQRERGKLVLAERTVRQAVKGFRRANGPRHPDTANARVLFGQILIARGVRVRGLAELEAATDILVRSRVGPLVAEIAIHALLATARALREGGRYDEARGRARVALRIARRSRDHTTWVAAAHNELGMIGKFSGRFAEAERHYRAARPMVRRLYGETSREMAAWWHNLGGLEHARENFKRGEPLARRAVEIARGILPANDAELVSHEVAHAALLDGLERHAESVPIYNRAISMYTRLFGRDHYEVGSTLHNLAAAEHALGHDVAAARHFQATLRIYARVLDRGHPDLALTLYNLGVLRGDRRKLKQAFAIFERSLGARHPHTRACRASLTQRG